MPPDEFYNRFLLPYEPQMIKAAWRMLGDEAEVGDVLQEAMARIWQHRNQAVQHANPKAWVLRITINVACDRLRARQAMHCRTPATPRTGEFTPLTTLIHRESNGRLRQAIARLSPQQAQAILLRLVEGLTYDDVAAALGCTNATARVHVQRGRANLRKELPDLVADRSGSEYLR